MTRHLCQAWAVLAGLALGFSAAATESAGEPSLVPRPATLELEPGEFPLRPAHALRAEPDDATTRDIATLLAERVARTCGRALRIDPTASGGAVVFRRSGPVGAAREGYRLDVQPSRLLVRSATDDGLRQGASTALQLLCAPGAASVPALRIDDAPALAWRGAMLDSARHYQSPEFIRRFLDAMALHKLNVLHWHLTDDQAWRLEIRKYPRLTEVGAWRVPAGAAARADVDPATGQPRRYGGYYDQATVRSIVAYAARLGITVVPEIEMPGHASAAIAAYPELGAKRAAVSAVPADWGVYANAFALDDATFELLEDVLRETMELFPSPWIHVGGDEVETGQWEASETGRELLRAAGTDDPKALQPWFTQRIGRFLEANGRKLVGWDEILAPGVPANAVVMSWRGTDGAIQAARAGHDAILSPWPTLYFDNRQVDVPGEPPGRLRVVSLEDVYRFEPIPSVLDASERGRILGVQGNLWTEHIRTESRVWHMGFPRLAAVAEIGWTPAARRDWPDFVRRLAPQYAHYAALGMAAADAAYAVSARIEPAPDGSRAMVALDTQADLGEVRYTLDGSDPAAASPRYESPLPVTTPATVRAAAFLGTTLLARPRTIELGGAVARARDSHDLALCGEAIPLALEDDAPVAGTRAIFAVDIQNPCWLWRGAALDGVTGVRARVGQVPFNFQIGAAADAIRFARPRTADGELEVRLDTCEGELLAALPLAPARASHGVTTLPVAPVPARTGRHDLCLRFAQEDLDPLWVLDRIELATP